MSGELYNEYGDINYENESIGGGSKYNSNKKKIYNNLAKGVSNYLSLTYRMPINGYKKKLVKIIMNILYFIICF